MMMMDADLLLAIELQEQYDREEASGAGHSAVEKAASSYVTTKHPPLMAVVDPSWELLDPSPNIHELFLQFNAMFFWGKLAGVEVKWSHRMTLCAGVCSYEGRGGLCSIRLSKPLLILRPRKDLVETLLHEMIHALLFVTDNNKDHDGHGPEFHKHMNRINGLTGAKISVFHSFHDEVEEYRKHWWQCNGPCRQRPPYFGYVKRAMNRAPSKLDPWWAEHQRSCGGTYVKVKEPEKKTGKDEKKTGKEKKKEDTAEVPPSNIPEVKGKVEGGDIRTFFPFSGTGYRLSEPSQVSVLVKVPPFSSNALTNSPIKPVQTASIMSSITNKSINPRPNLPSALSSVTNKSINPRPNLPSVFSSGTKSINPRPNLPSALSSVTNKSINPRPNLPSVFSSGTKSINPRPKVSVANTNAFKNINGSPIRLPVHGRNVSKPAGSNLGTLNGFTQKRLSFVVPTSSQGAPSTSQGSSQESEDRPSKRLRLDTKTAKDNFPGDNSFKEEPIIILDGSSSSNSTANHSNQSKTVNCPVCGAKVVEAKINEHLDNCLNS